MKNPTRRSEKALEIKDEKLAKGGKVLPKPPKGGIMIMIGVKPKKK